MRFLIRHTFPLLLPLLLLGCRLYDDRCGPEARSVTALLRVQVGAEVRLSAQLDLVERRADAAPRSYTLHVEAAPLAGRVSRVRLVDARDASVVYLDVPPDGAGAVIVSRAGRSWAASGSWEELFRRARESGLVLELTTDPAAPPAARETFRTALFNDWSRAHCS
jgi:hypothetical protein